MSTIGSYYTIALQTRCDAVNKCRDRTSASAVMHRTIARIATEIRGSKQFIGPDVRLVVLPEYFLTAYPEGDTIPGWAEKAALDMDGPEYDALGKIAADNDLYLAGNAYERDPHFPGLYFQTSFIIAPTGSVILRYRRVNSMYSPTPHDVWDKYLDIYGYDAVFPVAETEIGTLAAIASEEILYPEIARCLAVKGAEIFLHSTSEVGSPIDTPKEICKKARAVENMSYVISANSGGIQDISLPPGATDGNSKVIDYRGLVLAEANAGETMTAFAEIDLGALRRYRRRPGMANYLSRQRFELFAPTYGQTTIQPANSLLDAAGAVIMPERKHFIATQTDVIRRLADTGRI